MSFENKKFYVYFLLHAMKNTKNRKCLGYIVRKPNLRQKAWVLCIASALTCRSSTCFYIKKDDNVID